MSYCRKAPQNIKRDRLQAALDESGYEAWGTRGYFSIVDEVRPVVFIAIAKS